MLVDYERAWFRLKRVIADKRSHGQRDLAVAMANLEIECSLDQEDPPTEAVSTNRPLSEADASASVMPTQPNPLLAKEARNGNSEINRHALR